MDVNQFTELITKLQSADNDIRKQAEEVYEKIEGPTKVAALFEAYTHHTNNSDVSSLKFLYIP